MHGKCVDLRVVYVGLFNDLGEGAFVLSLHGNPLKCLILCLDRFENAEQPTQA